MQNPRVPSRASGGACRRLLPTLLSRWQINWFKCAGAAQCRFQSAVHALLAGVLGDGPQGILSSATRDVSPLSGMVTMYRAFHLAPWLNLVSSRQNGARTA